MMKISILLFGNLSEIAGKSELELENISTSLQLLDKLESIYPKMKNVAFRIAVNNNFVEDDTKFRDGDQISLMPPFAGG